MINPREIRSQIFDQRLKIEDSLSDHSTIDGALLVCMSTISRDSHLVVSTLDILLKQLGCASRQAKVVLGWNDGIVPIPVQTALDKKNIGWTIWDKDKSGNFQVTQQSKTKKDINHIEMLRSNLGSKRNGKLGMHHDITDFINSSGSQAWGGIPEISLLMDSESRFSPTVVDLWERYQETKKISVARYTNTVYDDDGPNTRIPISLRHVMNNLKHPDEGYLTGGGYIGNTVEILGTLSAIHSILPGVVAEDAALALINKLDGRGHSVSKEVFVTNKTSPAWDVSSWTRQVERWSRESAIVSQILDEKLDTHISPERGRQLIAQAIYKTILTAISYQKYDKRSVPSVINSIMTYSRNYINKKLRLHRTNNYFNERELVAYYDYNNATW